MGLELSQIFIIFCLSLSCSAFSILNQSACPSPKLSKHVKIAKIIKPSVYGERFPEGAIIKFACDEGYTLFGPTNTSCKYGDWHDEGPECLLEVAKGSPCHMSSQPDEYASAHLSTDGDPQSCVSFASNESHLLWSVDTFQAHSIRVVTVLTQFSLPNSTVEIRVGSHHPATGAKFNSLCTRQEVTSSQKREHEFLCDQGPINGRYVSISLVEPGTHHVSFCEVRVYSDSGLSIQDSCSDQILSNKTARFVFENQCVQFIGEQTHSEAVEACQQRKGTVVRPYSRAFQNFLDFNVYQYVETALDQVSISYWIDAERLSKTNDWEFGDGSKIQKIQIRDDAAEQCLVSEMRNWHSEGCDNQHQVICVSAPASCGTPGVPEFSSKWDRSKLAVDDVMEFACEIGTSEFFANIKCFPNGTLSEEPSCVPTSNDDFVESLNFMAKLRRCLRSMTMFANFSTWALNVLAAALGILSATVLCAIIACGFRVLKRYRESKISKRKHWSLMSFSVHMRDLPINSSFSRLYRTPQMTDGKFLTVPKEVPKS